MRILIAEDEPIACRLLELMLARWGHQAVLTRDGQAAWEVLSGPGAPRLAILDWTMPGLDGRAVCSRIHERGVSPRPYLILLSSNHGKANLIAGLGSGADDYVTKPFDPDELHARVNVGLRVLELQNRLSDRIRELESALAQIKQLQGLLPICMYCKKIRVDPNYWEQVEAYIAQHTDARFSHGICPDCYEGVVKPEVARVRRQSRWEGNPPPADPLPPPPAQPPSPADTPPKADEAGLVVWP
jgi:CheY-like chemotaxis protein